MCKWEEERDTYIVGATTATLLNKEKATGTQLKENGCPRERAAEGRRERRRASWTFPRGQPARDYKAHGLLDDGMDTVDDRAG